MKNRITDVEPTTVAPAGSNALVGRCYNTLTNEFGDRITINVIRLGMRPQVIAKNIELNKHEYFQSEKNAKAWLNKFRKAKKWKLSKE